MKTQDLIEKPGAAGPCIKNFDQSRNLSYAPLAAATQEEEEEEEEEIVVVVVVVEAEERPTATPQRRRAPRHKYITQQFTCIGTNITQRFTLITY